jgi:hypothetical protein
MKLDPRICVVKENGAVKLTVYDARPEPAVVELDEDAAKRLALKVLKKAFENEYR